VVDAVEYFLQRGGGAAGAALGDGELPAMDGSFDPLQDSEEKWHQYERQTEGRELARERGDGDASTL
jgi:hypothetical protein